MEQAGLVGQLPESVVLSDKSMNKKYLLLFLVLALIAIVFLVTLFPSLFEEKKSSNQSILPTPTPVTASSSLTPPADAKINISGIFVNNFLQNPIRTDKSNDVYLVENKKYQIVYLALYNQFLISIQGSPFIDNKKMAEDDLLKTLGISQEQACVLNVSINTPYFANPDYSGKNFPLSFCEKN